MFNQYNFGERKFDYDTTDFQYYSCEELYHDPEWGQETIFEVYGGFIVKSDDPQFADHPVAILYDRYLSLPAHTCRVWREILENEEMVQAIRDGKLGLSIYSYYKKAKGGKQTGPFYTVKYHDLEPDENEEGETI